MCIPFRILFLFLFILKCFPFSDYYSLLSGSYASSPLPSPTPSVAGSATSSCGSMLHRRPLISPARLNLKGQKLSFSPTQFDKTRHNFEEVSYPDGNLCPLEFTNYMTKSLSELSIISSWSEFMYLLCMQDTSNSTAFQSILLYSIHQYSIMGAATTCDFDLAFQHCFSS